MELVSSLSSQIDKRVISVCDACGDFIEYWGFKSIHGRVWTYLSISARPLSQTEIAKALDVSRASVCIAISELSEYGLVRPSSHVRHAPYEAVIDVWPVISNVLREREWMLLETARVALEGALNELERAQAEMPDEPRLKNYNFDRIKMLLQMTEWAQSILKLIINAKLPRATERWSTWMSKAMTWSSSLKTLLGREED